MDDRNRVIAKVSLPTQISFNRDRKEMSNREFTTTVSITLDITIGITIGITVSISISIAVGIAVKCPLWSRFFMSSTWVPIPYR